MSEWLDAPLSRRELLIGSAASATLLAPVASQAARLAEGQNISVLVHDRRIAPEAPLIRSLQARGARIVMLGEDPVRQWRDETAPWLVARNARLMGVTRWPDFLILRGLAAEARRHVRFVSPVSADGVLTWLIA